MEKEKLILAIAVRKHMVQANRNGSGVVVANKVKHRKESTGKCWEKNKS